MSLLIPSGHHKREAIALIHECIREFIYPGALNQEKLISDYIAWLYNNGHDINIQAKIEIDGPKLGLGLIVTNSPTNKDQT